MEKAAVGSAKSASDPVDLSPVHKRDPSGHFDDGAEAGTPHTSIPAIHGHTTPQVAAAPPMADPGPRPNTNPGAGAGHSTLEVVQKQVAARPATAQAGGGGGTHAGHIQPLLFHRMDLVVRPLVGNKCARADS